MTRKAKIIFYTETYLVGGAERFLFDLASHLDLDRYDISFACNDNPELIQAARQRIVPSVEINVVQLPVIITKQLANVAQSPSPAHPVVTSGARGLLIALVRYVYITGALRPLYRLFECTHADILHVNNGGYPGGQSCRAAILAAAQTQVPVRVMMIHNLAYPRPSIRLVEQWLDRQIEKAATHIVTASLASRDALVGERGFSPVRIRNVYYGVIQRSVNLDACRRCRAEIDLDEVTPLIGMVAAFEPRKGHRYLLQALPEIIRRIPSARVVLLGSSGGDEENVRHLAIELGLTERVFFLGRRQDVIEWMSSCDLIVLPSTEFESLPYVILEAMSVGKPVIGTRVGGIPEEIEDGVTGYVVPPADASALANAMIKILSDPDRAARMGQAARERVQRMFSLNQMIDAMQSIYTGAADKR